MRIVETMIAIILVSVFFAGQSAICNSETQDLSEYYGFQEIEIIKLDWGIKDLRIVDLNGDGRNDIIIVNNRKARIELLLQKDAVGPGETEVAVDPNDVDINAIVPLTRFAKQNIAVSQKVYSLTCGDLDSDGMADLAFYGEPKGLYVILQKVGETDATKQGGQPGILSWRTRKKIEIADGLLTSDALACADLNSDGTDDLAMAGRDAVYIIVQEKGRLAEPVKYPTTSLTLGVRVGDLNGDDINDLILITTDGEKPIHVRFGLETGQLGPQVQFFTERPFELKLHNIDGAAGDEMLIVDSRTGRLICYKLISDEGPDADWPILFYPLASGKGQRERDLVVGDFDGDGLADVTISDPGAAELIFYKQIDGLGLSDPVRFPAFADVTGLCAADIDEDGKTELAVLSVKEKVIGTSEFEDDRFSFPQPLTLTDEPVAMGLADVDGNGSVDCLYISRDVNDVKSLRVIYHTAEADKEKNNLPKGKGKKSDTATNVEETEPALVLKELVSNPDGLKVLDVDQDGLQDVLIFVRYELPTLVRQVRKRKFEVVDRPGTQASLIKDASLRSIAVADVDGEAGEELLVAQNNFARSLVFANGRSWTIIDQYNAKSTENALAAVAAFDIETERSTDGPTLLLLDGQKGQLQMLKASDDKTYRFVRELDVGKWSAVTHLKMLFAPLMGGEAKSILLFDSEKLALITPPSKTYVQQDLNKQFSYETKIKDGVYGNLAVGDINCDQFADIVMVEYNRHHIEILSVDSDTMPIPAMRFKVFEEKSYRNSNSRAKASIEPRELKIADVTGDGKDDLVTIIHDRIIVYPQD